MCVGEEILQLCTEGFTLLLALDQVFDGLLQLSVILHVLQSLLRSHKESVFEIALQLRYPAPNELQVFLDLLVARRRWQDVLNDALLDCRHCFAF